MSCWPSRRLGLRGGHLGALCRRRVWCHLAVRPLTRLVGRNAAFDNSWFAGLLTASAGLVPRPRRPATPTAFWPLPHDCCSLARHLPSLLQWQSSCISSNTQAHLLSKPPTSSPDSVPTHLLKRNSHIWGKTFFCSLWRKSDESNACRTY